MDLQSDTSEFNPYDYGGSPNVNVFDGYLAMFCGVCVFSAVNFVAIIIGPSKNMKGDVWRWRNTLVSWIHACIVGACILYCFMCKPEIFTDMILHCDSFTYSLVAFSLGYFVYDFLDHIMNHKLVSNYEVILHHIGVLWSLGYNIQYRVNIPYAIIGLMVEVNSIFLHGRKLMQLEQWPFDHWLYKLIVGLNMLTMVRYRIWGIILIGVGVYTEWHRLTLTYQVFIVITMFVMYVINPILFWRLVKNDVLRHWRPTVEKNDNALRNGTYTKSSLTNGVYHVS